MATYSSSSATGAGSMRAVLMLMLLMGAVVAAHGHQVSCQNKCKQPVTVNGVVIAVDATVNIHVVGQVTVKVVDLLTGVLVSETGNCPKEVTALVVVCESGIIKLKVKATGLLNVLIGLVLCLLPCHCH